MTACVNNQNEVKGGVSHKVLRSVVAGVLAVSMVPTAAMATEGAEADVMASASVNDNVWAKAKVTWNLKADQYGRYITDLANPLLVENIVDSLGQEMDPSDYSVLYFEDTNNDGKLTDADALVSSSAATHTSVNGDLGGVPGMPGKYFAMVIAGEDPHAGEHGDGNSSYIRPSNYSAKFTQAFTIQSAEVENKFESIDVHQDGDAEDTSFKYGVANQSIVFSVDGEELTEATDYTIRWNGASLAWNTDGYDVTAATAAGTYSATLYGLGEYAGAQGTVEFTIDAIDLSKDVVSIDTKKASDGFNFASDGQFGYGQIKVNGEALMGSIAITATATKFENAQGEITYMPTSKQTEEGLMTVEVAPAYVATGNKNVTGSAVVATGLQVANVVNFFYNDEPVADSLKGKTFTISNGEVFNPAFLEANTGTTEPNGSDKKFTYTVTKDGKEVSSYTEPGEYVVTLNAPVEGAFASAGSTVVKFNVVEAPAPVYSVFYSIDGKAADGNFYYTGKAYEPVIAVYDEDDNKAAEGTDYTVSFEKDGKAVESMVDAGEYTVKIEFSDERCEDQNTSFQFEVKPATILSLEASADFYAYTGEAIAPSFVGNTKADGTGLSLEITSADSSVKYYAADEDGEITTEVLSASEIVEAGTYWAKVTLGPSVKNFTMAANKEVSFKVSKTAGFTDVSSSDWFAESVYKAKELQYINGIQGTTLFAPLSDIDRAQIAAIMFNMARDLNAPADTEKDYPTKFSDVDASAWYAQAVSWASTAGVVNGYDEDTFGTFDKATREQVAAMFYNYAKAMGQDVTVEDEAAALAKVSDADTVSGWAKTAVAWAIENGVMGNGGYIAGQDYITRAEVAAMAVNFQPERLK